MNRGQRREMGDPQYLRFNTLLCILHQHHVLFGARIYIFFLLFSSVGVGESLKKMSCREWVCWFCEFYN